MDRDRLNVLWDRWEKNLSVGSEEDLADFSYNCIEELFLAVEELLKEKEAREKV